MSNKGTFATIEMAAYRYHVSVQTDHSQAVEAQTIEIMVEPMAESAESTATYIYKPSRAWADTRIFQAVCDLSQQFRVYPLP